VEKVIRSNNACTPSGAWIPLECREAHVPASHGTRTGDGATGPGVEGAGGLSTGTWPSFRLADVLPEDTKEPMCLFIVSVLDDMPKEIQPPDDLLQLRKRMLVEDDFSE